MAATCSVIDGEAKEMRDMFERETRSFRLTKRYIDVNNDEEFKIRFEQMKIDLTRIRCLHDLRRQDIVKSEQLRKNGELMSEIRKQIAKLDEWEKYVDNLERKRMSVEGLSK